MHYQALASLSDFYEEGKHLPYGVGDSLRISGETIAADLDVVDPATGTRRSVIGILEKIFWSGGPSDPIVIQAYLSRSNAETLEADAARRPGPARCGGVLHDERV